MKDQPTSVGKDAEPSDDASKSTNATRQVSEAIPSFRPIDREHRDASYTVIAPVYDIVASIAQIKVPWGKLVRRRSRSSMFGLIPDVRGLAPKPRRRRRRRDTSFVWAFAILLIFGFGSDWARKNPVAAASLGDTFLAVIEFVIVAALVVVAILISVKLAARFGLERKVTRAVRKHRKVLARKRLQTVRADDYGNTVLDRKSVV